MVSLRAMPVPTDEAVVTPPDGVALHVERFLPEGAARGVLVFVHGFSAHIGNFRHVGQACAAAGLATTLFDCRGHGRSQGRRGYVGRFSDFTDDLQLVLEDARALTPGVPVALVGHSQGGLVCVDYVLSARPPVHAMVLVAPWFRLKLKVPMFKLVASRLLGHVWPTLTMGNGLRGEDVSRNPEVLAGLESDALVHHVATPRWFNEIRAAQDRIIQAAPRLRVPTLMLVAGDDRVVSTDAALNFARDAGPAVEVRMYDNLFHEMFLEPERDQVIADLVAWLTSRFGA